VATKILDLDEIASEEPEFVLKLDQVDHPLVQMTVEGFIENAKLLKEIDAKKEAGALDATEEFNIVLSLVNAAFPSIGMPRLKKLPLDHLRRIMEFAQDKSAEGEKEVKQPGNE
jgi:hypothetical protein